MRIYISFIVFFLLFSCGSIHVNYDYDKETEFSSYTTYNYYDDMQTGMSDLDNKRFFRVLDIALQSKGLKLAEEPDLLIDIKSNIYQVPSNSSVSVGLGGGRRGIGGGVSVGVPLDVHKTQRELTIDFVDAKRNTLVWQAVSESNFTESDPPTKKEEKMQELVTKILEKYPPKR